MALMFQLLTKCHNHYGEMNRSFGYFQGIDFHHAHVTGEF